MRYSSHSEKETEAIGAEIAGLVSSHDMIAMYGEMGSGKTVFMRGFVGALVPEARVSSPTYALLNVYANEKYTVHHFDLYRITSEDDLASIGFWDVLESGITVCEWSENIEGCLPDAYWKLNFEKKSENERELVLERVER